MRGKKIKKLVIVLSTMFLLVGCIDETQLVKPIQYPTVLIIGDSICSDTVDSFGVTASEALGIVQDCEFGRSMLDVPNQLPLEYELIFLSLGSVDGIQGTVPMFFEYSLKRKLKSVKKTIKVNGITKTISSPAVVCIYPNSANPAMTPYRLIMIDYCEEFINPNDWGVRFRAEDRFHMTAKDHRKLEFPMQLYINIFVDHGPIKEPPK